MPYFIIHSLLENYKVEGEIPGRKSEKCGGENAVSFRYEVNLDEFFARKRNRFNFFFPYVTSRIFK